MSLSEAKAPTELMAGFSPEREIKATCCKRLLPNSIFMQQPFATNSTLKNATRKLLRKGSLLQHGQAILHLFHRPLATQRWEADILNDTFRSNVPQTPLKAPPKGRLKRSL